MLGGVGGGGGKGYNVLISEDWIRRVTIVIPA